MLEELDRGDRHRAPRVRDDDLRHTRGRRAARRRARPRRRRSRRSASSWPSKRAPAHAEEERARSHGSRVVREIRDLDGGVPDDLARGERFCDACELHWGAAEPSNAPVAATGEGSVAGASGGISRYCRSNPAICWKAGAATTPPQIDAARLVDGDEDHEPRVRSRGRCRRTRRRTSSSSTRRCGSGFAAVPVLPATLYPGTCASCPVPSMTTSCSIRSTCRETRRREDPARDVVARRSRRRRGRRGAAGARRRRSRPPRRPRPSGPA